MIAWLSPATLAGLALLAGPVLVHLLLRHRASRVPFPSLRFLRVSRTAAARLRRPSDPALLLLRLAILALAVIALAQPLLLTPPRVAAWNRRIARAILLDVSESMKPVTGLAEKIAGAETQSAGFAFRLNTTSVAADLRRAAAMLATVPPARREIVVVSDFQAGTFEVADFKEIPPDIGVRFVDVGQQPFERLVRGIEILSPLGMAPQELLLTAESTRAHVGAEQPGTSGLTLLAAAPDRADAERLRRAVVAAGAPAPSAGEAVVVAFAGAARPAAVQPLRSGWMLDTVLRLERDSQIIEASAQTRVASVKAEEHGWYSLFSDRDGHSLVRAAALTSGLLLDVAAPPDEFVAAAVVRGVLIARAGPPARPEEEVRRMPKTALAALTRTPSPVTPGVRQFGQLSDARWCWLLVLVLLAAETMARREPQSTTAEARSDAA